MNILRIFVSGIIDDRSLERDAIARAIASLRVEATRIEVEYAAEDRVRGNSLHHLHACGIFIGVYERTRYGKLIPAENVSASEFEFDQAQEAKKPTLIFVKNIEDVHRASSRQDEFIGRVTELSSGKFGFFQFDSPDHLESLIANALQELLVTRFFLAVKRPPFRAPNLPDPFVERHHVQQQILTALTPGKPVILHGLGDVGGLGKTCMAISVAHQAREIFSDGILWANISTARPADRLANWARPYGGLDVLGRGDLRFVFRPLSLEARQVAELTTRINAVRDLLRGKRVLAILDGVMDERDEERVQPLLSALSHCAVLVTSRTTHLSAFKFAIPIELPRLTEDEAWQLFSLVAGEERLSNRRALVRKITQVVDSLPLALHLVASQLREDETWTLNSLALALEKERNTLDTERRGYSTARGMQTALNTSYSRLNSDDKKFWGMLGAFAGDDFDVDAAVFVADMPRTVVAERLERLTRLGLVQSVPRRKRYTLHPVLQAMARSKLGEPDADLRMAAYYCALARENGKKLQGNQVRSALQILDIELSNIFAGYHWARLRNDRTGWELCRDFVYGAMTYYFNLKSMWSDWITWSIVGVEACYKLGDERSASSIAGSLGMVYYRRGELDQAIEFYKQALAIMEKLGRAAGSATIHMNLGNVQTEKREWKDAIESHARALQLYERLGYLRGQAQTRANLGMLYAKYGDRTKARANWLQALEIFDHLGAEHEADIVRKWLGRLMSKS